MEMVRCQEIEVAVGHENVCWGARGGDCATHNLFCQKVQDQSDETLVYWPLYLPDECCVMLHVVGVLVETQTAASNLLSIRHLLGRYIQKLNLAQHTRYND